MAWLHQSKNVVRGAVLILLLVAIVGPWTYSSDGAPPAEWCRDPNILLENERCVRLVSGIEVLTFMTSGFLSMNVQLAKGTLVLADRAREFFGVFLFVVLLFLLVQPFFSTLLLIFGGDRPRRRMYHVATWGLAAVISALLLVASCWSGLHTDLWGIWLYVGLAASALAVELSAVRPTQVEEGAMTGKESRTVSITNGLAEVNRTRLYYEVIGDGRSLVLIHGDLVDSRMWDLQWNAFGPHYCVIRYDRRGYGKSDAAVGPYSDHQDLYELLKFLGVEQAYLLGLSGGGAVAINFALEYPERVDALILCSSGLSGYIFSEEVQRYSTGFRSAIKRGDVARAVELSLRVWTDGPQRTADQVNPAIRERVREMGIQAFGRSWHDANPQRPEPAAIHRLAEIDVRTLIVVGNQDMPDISAIADLLQGGIAGARRVVVPGVAHMVNMEQPKEFNRLVLDFLGG